MMFQINYLTGDATRPAVDGPKIIAHICNDIGGWGKGFVVAVSRRWPAPEADYRAWYAGRDANDFALGAVQFVLVEQDFWVANMIAQRGLHSSPAGEPPIRYDAVKTCLARLAEFAAAQECTVHMPRIGCGLAGGKWEDIEPLIEETCVAAQVPVYVYDFR